MKNKLFLCTIFTVVAAIFVSCGDITDDGVSAQGDGKAYVSFALSGQDARTIVPKNMTESDVVKVELAAEILDGDEYVDYSFNGDSASLTWESLDDMRKAVVPLDVGQYNFTLTLYTTLSAENSNEYVAQVATLESVSITLATTTLAFTAKYVDEGNLAIKLIWPADENDQSRIGSVKAGLFTVESKGTEPLVISTTDPEASTSFDYEACTQWLDTEDGYGVGIDSAYIADYEQYSLPNGSYYLKIQLYDVGQNPVVLNTIIDIVKIHGFRTEKVIVLDLADINIMYDLKYNLNEGSWTDGSDADSKDIRRNAYTGVILPTGTDIERRGHTFGGWYTDEECTDANKIEKIDATTTAASTAKDYDLYAKWVLDSYDIEYDLDGGTNAENNPATYSVLDSVELLEAEKKGYIFGGWYTENDFSDDSFVEGWEPGEKTGDINLFSKWSPISYTIAFDKNAADAEGEISSISATYDEDAKLPANEFKYTGFTFAGWATSSDGEVVYADSETVSKLTETDGETITLYAKWIENAATITVSLDAIESEDDLTLNYDETTRTFSVDGTYAAYAWIVGDTTVGTDSTYTIGEFTAGVYHIMLAAKKNADDTDFSSGTGTFTVRKSVAVYTFDLAGGTTTTALSKKDDGTLYLYGYEGDTLTIAEPTKTGSTFAGWTENGESVSLPSAFGSTSRTFTATWE